MLGVVSLNSYNTSTIDLRTRLQYANLSSCKQKIACMGKIRKYLILYKVKGLRSVIVDYTCIQVCRGGNGVMGDTDFC